MSGKVLLSSSVTMFIATTLQTDTAISSLDVAFPVGGKVGIDD